MATRDWDHYGVECKLEMRYGHRINDSSENYQYPDKIEDCDECDDPDY